MCGRVTEGLEAAEQLLALGGELPDLHLFSQVVAGATAAHAGEGDRAAVLFAGVTSAATEPRPNAAEIATFDGLARLEVGDVAGALDVLDRGRAVASTPGLVASLEAVRALGLAAAGRIDEIVDLDAEVAEAASFLDRARHDVALACAAAQRGDEAAVDAALGRARERLDATDDRFDQSLVVLAHGLARAALGHPDAEDLLVYARTRLAGMGAAGQGWETLLSLAVTGGAGLPASVAAIPSAAPR
jgi:hypothetical protein